jgi:hypothetical protein
MLHTPQGTPAHDCTPTPHQRLRLVIFQEAPSVWIVRGLEHDFTAEGRTIGAAVRGALGFLQAHAAFDARHDHEPLAAFRSAPQALWNAYAAGTPIELSQLGLASPDEWDVSVSVAHRAYDRRAV